MAKSVGFDAAGAVASQLSKITSLYEPSNGRQGQRARTEHFASHTRKRTFEDPAAGIRTLRQRSRPGAGRAFGLRVSSSSPFVSFRRRASRSALSRDATASSWWPKPSERDALGRISIRQCRVHTKVTRVREQTPCRSKRLFIVRPEQERPCMHAQKGASDEGVASPPGQPAPRQRDCPRDGEQTRTEIQHLAACPRGAPDPSHQRQPPSIRASSSSACASGRSSAAVHINSPQRASRSWVNEADARRARL